MDEIWKPKTESAPNSDIPAPGEVTPEFSSQPELEDRRGELERSDAVLIPTYNAIEQFTGDDLDAVWPEWRTESESEDAELMAIRYARTNTLREMGRRLPLGNNLVNLGGEGLMHALDNTPVEVGKQFDAHGIKSRQQDVDPSEQLDVVGQLDRLLRGGIDPNRKFYSMEFNWPKNGGDIGAEMPYTEGGLIVVGGVGEKLVDGGIKYVVTGEEYSSVLDIFRKRYPGVVFVPWEDAPTFFTDLTNKAGITNIPLEDLRPSTPIEYHPIAEEQRVPMPGAVRELTPEEKEKDMRRVREEEKARRQADAAADPNDAVW